MFVCSLMKHNFNVRPTDISIGLVAIYTRCKNGPAIVVMTRAISCIIASFQLQPIYDRVEYHYVKTEKPLSLDLHKNKKSFGNTRGTLRIQYVIYSLYTR